MTEDEAPPATFEDRVNKQMRKEAEEANRDWVRAQKLTDYLWEQKLASEAPYVDDCIEIAGFRERRYRTSCHVGKHDPDFGDH